MNFDIAIIGGGPAGYTAAERAGANGLKTVLFERKQFRDAIIESKSVTEMNSSKAKDELNKLIIEIL